MVYTLAIIKSQAVEIIVFFKFNRNITIEQRYTIFAFIYPVYLHFLFEFMVYKWVCLYFQIYLCWILFSLLTSPTFKNVIPSNIHFFY